MHFYYHSQDLNQIPQLHSSNNKRKHISTTYNENLRKRQIVDNQVKKMSYDRNYTKRVTEIMKFVTHSMSNDIVLKNVLFHYGWDFMRKKMTKGKQVQVVEARDPDKRFMTLEGVLMANPSLQEQYYESFKQKLMNSELLYDITQVEYGSSKAGKLFFTLRCEF